MTIEITQELLNTLLRYDPETGKLFWKARDAPLFKSARCSKDAYCKTWNTRFADKEAITAKDQDGYLVGTILRKNVKAHRVIWEMVHGESPDQIDHINGVTDDNRISNLRNVSNKENGRNQKKPINNTSNTTGITWHKGMSKWQVRIGLNGKSIYLGRFDSICEAKKAREQANIKYGFHENHGRR